MKKNLTLAECLLSLSLIVLLISLVVIAKYQRHRAVLRIETLSFPIEEFATLEISGEVGKPGPYAVLVGSRLGDAIKKSRPKPFADFQGIDFDSPVKKSMALAIPRLSEMVVRVEGEVVFPLDLKIAPGTRICDLKPKISLSDRADPKFMKRRRLLKPGEVIVIPERKQRSSQAR